MVVSAPRHLVLPLVGLALALACDGGDVRPGDAGTDAVRDATMDDRPAAFGVTLTGPAVAFLGEPACFVAAHPGGAAAEIDWIWGDGARETTPERERCHTYAVQGGVLMGVVVNDGSRRADASLPVTVVPRPADPRPTSSSTITYDAARDRVWVVAPDADTVAVLDAATSPPTLERELDACDHPRTIAVSGTVVAVACQGDGILALFDATSLARLATVPLGAGSEPVGVVGDPRGGRFLVALEAAGELAVVAEDGEVLGRAPVGPEPRALGADGEGRVLVTRFRSREEGGLVTLVDASDPAAPRVVSTATLPPQVGLDSDTDSSGVPSFLGALVMSPDGSRALVPAVKANVVSGVFRNGLPLSSQTTCRGTLAEISLLPDATIEETLRVSFNDLDFASAAVFSPLGERVYVSFLGAQRLLVLDGTDLSTSRTAEDVGVAPSGLALDPEERRLFVDAFLSRAVLVYDVSDHAAPPRLVAEVPTVGEEPLSPDVLAGKRLFYTSRDPRMSRDHYLSCASCHLDGEADGLTWDFTQRGEGLRNTIPLRGRAGLAHGPVHWTANFDEIQDFEHDIRSGQEGTGFLPDALFHQGTRDTPLGDPKAGLSADLDALAAYVASLAGFGTSPLRRDGDASFEAAIARGRAVFVDPTVGCADCHAGPDYTDSGAGLHDVGTATEASGGRLGGALPGFDTPTLRGLWRSAPYLHDGSAATLREVLVEKNPDDRHGATRALDDAQLDDLVLFLATLDDHAPGI